MRKFAVTSILWWLLLLVPSIFTAQLDVKNHYGVTGKKDAPVRVISQDLTGFLLIATSEGLYQYDGKSSQVLFSEFFRADREITALFVDSRNNIWIGTKEGRIFVYDRKKLDTLTFQKGEIAEKITSFCEIKNTIFASTYGNGLFSFKGGVVKEYNASNGLTDNVIYNLSSNDVNTMWCATDAGITQILLSDSTLSFSSISTKNGLPDNIVRNIFVTENLLLVAMQDSGICYYNQKTRSIERLQFFRDWSFGAVIVVNQQNDGTLTLATEREGLFQIRHGVVSVINYGETLKADHISQMFCDREKSFWLASPRGVSQISTNRYHLITKVENKNDSRVSALVEDNNRVLWMAGANGYSRMSRDAEGKAIFSKIAGFEDYITSCAVLAPDGKVWFGTYGHGILVMGGIKNEIIQLNSKNGNLSNDNVSSIFFDGENDVYVATLGGGILKAKYDDEKIKLERIALYTESEGLGSNYVYAAITGTDGLLYAATDGGGLQVLKNNSFVDLTKRFGLRSNTAFSLCRDPAGHITATSNADGLLHYDGRLLKRYRASNGLRDEQPAQIIASNNDLICIHSRGIDKLNCMNNNITYYDLPDVDFEANLNAIAYRDGYIYSGTSNGIITYRTGKEHNDSIKPKVYIKQFYLGYKPFPFDSIFEFKHNQNSMGFAFDGIWLKRPDQLNFRYKLVGLEEDWQNADEGKTINYNNLNPGNYTFIVQVQNDEEIWSDPEAYAFIILTPIWKHWWFWTLILLAVAFGVYFFIRYRLRLLQRENILLERRVTERTHQIERQTKIIEEKNKALEQLSLVASKTDNVVLILDANGKLEYINQSFEKLIGMNLEQLTTQFGQTIFELSSNSNIREIFDEAVSKKKSVNYESLNEKVQGAHIWQSSTLTPIFEDDGSLRKVIIIDTDVTLRKKQEQIIIQKNIDITDSIAYARKIQRAILPPVAQIKQHIPELFVFYLTKDIVSGDFYWFGHFKDYSIIAAIDCTGHGVPGAFMSLIGHNQLNRIVNEQRIKDPAKILAAMNDGVLDVIHKNESESKDGMDMAICRIDHKTNKLFYAGAMRPLWIVSNDASEVREIRADKIPIGTKHADRADGIEFTTHEVDYQPGDNFYIFTDGYADQFGGPKDKKYSTGRFKDFLCKIQKSPADEKEAALLAEHLSWKGDHEQIDDILVIGFRL